MKVVIDARWIFHEMSGIGLYTQELIRALASIDHDNQYVLLFQEAALRDRTWSEAELGGAKNFEARIVPYGPFSPKGQLRLPPMLKGIGADIFHSTNWMMPLLSTGYVKRVVTIHDLIPLLFRDHAPRSRKERFFPLYKRLMCRVAHSADMIIAVSDATRVDIVDTLRVPLGKICTTLEGVRSEYRPPFSRPVNNPPVILFVGRRDPYKNLPLLVEAFARLLARGVRAKLKIIGPADERYPEAPRRARELGIFTEIEWIGYASPEALVQAYQTADLFVLPSRYEGFGLTVLEAMACGTPVVCSRTSSLPEVVGDAAILVEPGQVDALTKAMEDVLTDRDLASELSAQGLRRAGLFTWERTARDTLEAYEKLMSQRS